MKLIAMISAVAALSLAAPAMAQQQFPMEPSDYVDVTGITVKQGHMMDYAKFLADEWRPQEEYALKQGWITGYEVLVNSYQRKGEPSLYLVTRFHNFADPAETMKRRKMFEEHMKTTMAEMQKGQAARDSYRQVDSDMLLRQWVFKK